MYLILMVDLIHSSNLQREYILKCTDPKVPAGCVSHLSISLIMCHSCTYVVLVLIVELMFDAVAGCCFPGIPCIFPLIHGKLKYYCGVMDSFPI